MNKVNKPRSFLDWLFGGQRDKTGETTPPSSVKRSQDDAVPFDYTTRRRTRVWKEVGYGKVFRASNQAEAADILRDAKAIAVVFGESGPKRVQFYCPCGCGEILRMNVSPTGPRPLWQPYIDNQGRISLYPSVDRTTGCLSHFILRQNTAFMITYEDEA